jgi:hypothetical protein
MRTGYVVWCLGAVLFFLALLFPAPGQGAENWVIGPGKGLGAIELGDTFDKVERCLGRTEVRMGSLLYWYVDEGLEFFAPANHIESIIIVKPSHGGIEYRGIDGIGVGSNEEQVVEKFGPAEKSLFSRSTHILQYVNEGITFYIKNGQVCKIVLSRGAHSQALTQ